MRKSHSEHFSTAVPQKADVVSRRGERQLRAISGQGGAARRPQEGSRTREVWHGSTWQTPDQDRRAPLRRLETNFSQGAKWKAAINTYIGTIPPKGDASCMAEQNMSGCPLL